MASRATKKRAVREGVTVMTPELWREKTTKPCKGSKPARARPPKPIPRTLRRAGWIGAIRTERARLGKSESPRRNCRTRTVPFAPSERTLAPFRERAPYGDRVASTGLPGRRRVMPAVRAWMVVNTTSNREARRESLGEGVAKMRRLARLHTEHAALAKAGPRSRDESQRLRFHAYQIREATPKAVTGEAA